MLRRTCFVLFIACVHLARLPVTHAATDYGRYLADIFQKYGSGDTITFEGLEHLMYNLGLGGIEFEPQHTIDEHRVRGQQSNSKVTTENEKNLNNESKKLTWEPNENQENYENPENFDVLVKDENMAKKSIILEFREMHDPKHRHPREKISNFDAPMPKISDNVCLSPQDVLRLVVNHDDLHKRKLYSTVKQTVNNNINNNNNNNENENENQKQNENDEHNTEAEYMDFINNVHLTPLAFMKLCPALLTQIDQHVCARPAPLKHADDSKEELWNAWIYATGSIFILSACGLLGIALVPLMETVAYQEILKFLIAIAVGTLSGDALMHLLPHALVKEHDDDTKIISVDVTKKAHSHDNTPVWICACAFATAVFMYMLEHLIPLLKNGADQGQHGHSHNHHKKNIDNEQNQHNSHHAHHHHHDHHHHHNGAHSGAKDSTNSDEPKVTGSVTIDTNPVEIREINVMLNETKLDMKAPKSKPLTPLAFMVIIGDGLHNLTDGLAIGAAFATDPVTGLATAFAVLCHELPHELGDFALLLQTGVSIKRAMVLNIVSSVLSFLGMAVGLLVAGLHSNMTQWIYAGTAGSFLYIAFADLMPAMVEDSKRSIKSVLIQIAGIIVGGLIMIVIAVNEDNLEELFK